MQVMQRISRSQLYQRELFQALRDGQAAVSCFSTSDVLNVPQYIYTREGFMHPHCKAPVFWLLMLCVSFDALD